MDKREQFEKMAEMMRICCKGEGDMADCCSMMKKMMRYGEGGRQRKRKRTPEKQDERIKNGISCEVSL